MAGVRSSATAKAATAIVLGMLLVTGVLVLTTGLGVQDLGPVIVYGVALTAWWRCSSRPPSGRARASRCA